MTLEQLVQKWRERRLPWTTNDYADGFRAAAAELESWLTANPAAQDTRRLDWLLRQRWELVEWPDDMVVLELQDDGETFEGKTVREAIDRAMSSQSLPASTPAEEA